MGNSTEGGDISRGGSTKARSATLLETEGHLLGVRPSTIPDAGRGLFLLQGSIKKGEVGPSKASLRCEWKHTACEAH